MTIGFEKLCGQAKLNKEKFSRWNILKNLFINVLFNDCILFYEQ